VKYACIQALQREFKVSMMCHALKVSRSGYYAALDRSPGKRKIARERLRLHVRGAFRKSKRRYGSPRVYHELRAQGIQAGLRQVAEIMREDGLRARPKRRFVVTTDSAHGLQVFPDLLQRRFDVAEHPVLNRAWVSDITYLPTREGWLYLAAVHELGSRRVVGWSTADDLDTSLPRKALEQAIWNRKPTPGMIHHSDRGSQYASAEYHAVINRHGIRPSMSRKGDCWDNAVAESFFATLEKELIEQHDWQTRDEARRDVFEFIEIWYNRQRSHSSLGYRSPAKFEAELALNPRAA
jgi:putative transposase